MSMFRQLLSKQAQLFAYNRSFKKLLSAKEVYACRSYAAYSNDHRLKLEANNVIGSPFPSVSGYDNILLHELIWMNVHKWSNKTALECSSTGRSYTYHQLKKLTGRLATSLRKAKIWPRDTVAVVLPNIPEYATVVLATSEAGLRATLINPMYTSSEIAKQLMNSEACAIFTTTQLYPIVKDSIRSNPYLRLPIIVIDVDNKETPPDTIKFEDLTRDDIEEFSKNEKSDVDSEDEVLLPYSSGTTGLPKGVQLSHRNMVANIMQIGCPHLRLGVFADEAEQDVVPAILPFFHIYGLAVILVSFLRTGSKIVCVPQYSMSEYMKILTNYKPTLLYLVPPIVHAMASNEEIGPRHVESVRYIICGAAPMGKESISTFRSRVSDTVTIVQGYGLTETSPVVTLSKDAPSDSVGYVVPNTQLRIVKHKEDGASENVKLNEVGEIYVRGPQIMKGYFKNPQATKDAIVDGWFKTGDLGSVDEKGLVHIQGRFKELIKVKGFQVSPSELEEIIKGLDEVEDVAVIGVPHEKYGEIPKAFIVPKKGVAINASEVKEYVAKHAASYKQIGHVQCIDQIPRSAAGKILRRVLQNL